MGEEGREEEGRRGMVGMRETSSTCTHRYPLTPVSLFYKVVCSKIINH